MNLLRFTFLLSIGLLTHLCVFANATNELNGTITDALTGLPIPNASVEVKNKISSLKTDMLGNYKLNLPLGTYTFIISSNGYDSKELSVKIAENQQKLPNIALIRILNDPEINTLTPTEYAKYLVQISLIRPRGEFERDIGMTERIQRSKRAILNRIRGESMANEQGTDEDYPNYSVSVPPAERKKTNHKESNTEDYSQTIENGYKNPQKEPLSTFSIDVDKASYSNVRRYLEQQRFPPAGSVRIEELVNYFEYDLPQPKSEHPFSATTEVSQCPWAKTHLLMRIGLQGRKMDFSQAPANNLVFLVDVSGSMDQLNKLPLVKQAFKILIDNLRPMDKIAIVVYAGAAGVVLPSTAGSNKVEIQAALERLQAGGSTAGAGGINLAYNVAKENFIVNGNNRVILATDGDFNVGVSSDAGLEKLIESKRKDGIFLTCMGFGYGNLKDNKLEILADKGNGNYYYIDNLKEANKIFSKEIGGTLYAIAKDVKLQLEFNPRLVDSFRLIGYENRVLNHEDFKDDTKDAGELGAGLSVTALYELIPKPNWNKMDAPLTDTLRYQSMKTTAQSAASELAFLQLRYKKPKEEVSILMNQTIDNQLVALEKTSDDFRFSAAVAAWGQILRESKFAGTMDFKQVRALAEGALGKDVEKYRADFLKLVSACEGLRAK